MIRLLGPLTFSQTREITNVYEPHSHQDWGKPTRLIPADNTKLWLSIELEYDDNSKELINKLIEDLQKIQKVINDHSQHQKVHDLDAKTLDTKTELNIYKEALEKWCEDCTGTLNTSTSSCIFIKVCPKKNLAKP